MDFRPLDELERKKLVGALRGNAEQGRVLLLDRRDTGKLAQLVQANRVDALKDIAPFSM